jgi:hypothetical protein
MKYILISIAYALLSVYLIIERSAKILITVLIFLWALKIDKKRFSFWNKVHMITPFIEIPLIEFDGIKNYFLFNSSRYFHLKKGWKEKASEPNELK